MPLGIIVLRINVWAYLFHDDCFADADNVCEDLVPAIFLP